MKYSVKLFLVLNCLIGSGHAVAQVSSANQTDAEKEIRAAADSFVNSFNKRDAAAIAAHWTDDGIYVDEEGARFEGRKAIQVEYQKLFDNNPDDLELRLEIDSIRLLNPQTVLEEGRAALRPQPPGEVRVMSRYTALHVKQNGQWLMCDVRDTLAELPPDTGELDDLDWLVGHWTATKDDVKLDVTFRWIENDQFLARNYTATKAGKVTSRGLQIIGVDPFTEQITSWTFSGDGAHAVGFWSPHDKGWIIDSSGVMRDGTETGATDILTPQDKDTLAWKSVDRTLGGEPLPDTPEITLNRM